MTGTSHLKGLNSIKKKIVNKACNNNKANSELSKHQPYTNKKREKYQIDGSCKTFKDQLKMCIQLQNAFTFVMAALHY